MKRENLSEVKYQSYKISKRRVFSIVYRASQLEHQIV